MHFLPHLNGDELEAIRKRFVHPDFTNFPYTVAEFVDAMNGAFG